VPSAADARLAGDDKRTRFVLDLDRAVAFRIFTLADPYRIILELPEVAFDLDGSAGQSGRGLVAAFRYGQFAAGKSRIVLDANAPVEIDKAFILEPIDDQPARSGRGSGALRAPRLPAGNGGAGRRGRNTDR
jgi:N-acetylmuramoyl-L-alanine amidase